MNRNTYTFKIFAPNHDFKYGDSFLVKKFKLKPIEDSFKNISSFSYKEYMREKNIINEIEIVDYLPIQKNLSFINKIKNFRMFFIEKNLSSYPDISSFLNALVFGEKQFSLELKDLFISTNIIHALTISGAHLVFLIYIIRFILIFFGLPNKYIDIIMCVFLPIYFIISGGNIPIFRAIFCELIFILSSKKIKRNTSLIIFLFLTFLLFPSSLFSMSFVLSFFITFIIYNVDLSNNFKTPILNILFFNIILSLLITPLVINLNYSFNFFSPFLNIIIIFIITFFLLPLSFLITFFHFPLLVSLYHVIIEFLIFLCKFFSYFTIHIGSFSGFKMILFCFLLFAFLRKKQFIYLFFCYLLLFLCSFPFTILGSVTFLDIGQGDSILIRLPFNSGTILIDTSTKKNHKELIQYLHYENIKTIDILIITHWHEDHYGSIFEVFKRFNVKKVYAPNLFPKFDFPLTVLKQGDSFFLKKFKFNVLSPKFLTKNENDNSLVILTTFGNKKWLFTGDLELPQEKQLLLSYPNLNIDFLKVGHHGSKTSSSPEFIKTISPTYSIISAGRNNIYKHPSPSVLKTLEEYSKFTYLTATHGMIKFNFIFDFIWQQIPH